MTTHEPKPGEQVLVQVSVRGQLLSVRGMINDRLDVAGGPTYLISIQGTRLLVEAADIVGPAASSSLTCDDEADAAIARIEKLCDTADDDRTRGYRFVRVDKIRAALGDPPPDED